MKNTGGAGNPPKKNNSRSGNSSISKQTKPKSRLSFWLHLVADLFVGAVILGVLYLFLEILPQYRQFQNMKAAMAAEPATEVTVSAEDQAEKTATVSFDIPAEETALAPEAAAIELADTPEVAEAGQAADIKTEEAPSDKTEIQESEPDLSEVAEEIPLREKFSEFFTAEIVKDKYSYTSPNISIQITKVKDEEHGSQPFNAYIADIHIASIESLKVGFPVGHRTETADGIAKDNNALLGVNGDYYLNINKGILIRNGIVLQDSEGTSDLCVVYQDGTMKTFGPGEYSVEGILNQYPWQVWSFGPALLDENGVPKTEFNTSTNIYNRNPRTAIGYYEPGHYCLITIDGRSEGNSNGATIRALAAMMSDLGCKAAYNLDGGDSSVMVFGGKTVNKPSGGGRKLSDIVMICELPLAGTAEEGAVE